MSEPREQATKLDRLPSGILHWSVHDDRIDARSDAYAVPTPHGAVLVDPLPLAPKALADLGDVSAICLTIQSHQRSAWRLRDQLQVPVHAPRGAEGLEAEPDVWYEDGARLPGDLLAVHAPGPCEASYALLLDADGGTLFVGDLLIRSAQDGPLGFVPDEYQDAPERSRESVRRLLELCFEQVCPGHGAPISSRGRDALAGALGRDGAL